MGKAYDYKKNLDFYFKTDAHNIGKITNAEKKLVLDYARKMNHVRSDHAETVAKEMEGKLGIKLVTLVLISTNPTAFEKFCVAPTFQRLVVGVMRWATTNRREYV